MKYRPPFSYTLLLYFVDRFLLDRSFILFLNKQDILAEKVASGRSKLEKYFPDYEGYTPGGKAKPFSIRDQVQINKGVPINGTGVLTDGSIKGVRALEGGHPFQREQLQRVSNGAS